MSLDPPHSLNAADVESWSDEVDVVVVGFGIAGGCAALEAARAGARVVLLERAAEHGGTSVDGRRPLLPRWRHGGAARRRRRGLRGGDVQVPDGGQPRPRRGQDPGLLRRQRRALRLDRGARHGVRAVALPGQGRHPARHRRADVHRQREGLPLPRHRQAGSARPQGAQARRHRRARRSCSTRSPSGSPRPPPTSATRPARPTWSSTSTDGRCVGLRGGASTSAGRSAPAPS